MAWGARSGLKHLKIVALTVLSNRLNGLGSPFGIETSLLGGHPSQIEVAKWPGEPVRD